MILHAAWVSRICLFVSLLASTAALGDPLLVFESQSGSLRLTKEDVIEAAPQFGVDGPGLSFRLEKEASDAFADLTEMSIGEVLRMAVCGDTLVEAVIQERIAGNGYVALESLGDATWYAARLNGDARCDEALGK